MTYGFIIAAGNQRRFKSDVPKALVPVGQSSIPLLYYNVELMRKYCDKVIVVCSNAHKEYFYEYTNRFDNAEIYPIDSGLGCGDAVYKALSHYAFVEKCIIQWGDSIQTKEIYEAMVSCNTTASVVIPCEIEDNPYVQLIPNEDNVEVRFSKFGDKITRGYHDLSIFYCRYLRLLDALHKIFCTYYNGQNYNMRNNEFSFLDVFNYTNVTAQVVEVNAHIDNAFNTVEEISRINSVLTDNTL